MKALPVSDRAPMRVGDALPWLALGGAALIAYKMFGPEPDRPPYVPPELDVPEITDPPTIPRQVARGISDAVYAALYASGGWATGGMTEDEAAVIAALTLDVVRVDADVLLIVDEYGVRGWLWSGELDLFGAVAAYLSASDREEINAAYASRGINVRF